jgi:hypothetical protein
MSNDDHIQSVREANERLRQAVAAAIDTARQPEVGYAAHLDAQGRAVTYSLVRGVWVETHPGLRVMLIDDTAHCGACPAAHHCPSAGCTRCLVEAPDPVSLPAHTHTCCESVHIVEGVLRDRYLDDLPHRRSGERVYYRMNMLHEPVLHGLFLICWSPPLKREANP